MKTTLLILSLALVQNLAFGGGETGGGTAGGNGGGAKITITRSIASVAEEDLTVTESVDNFGKECLQTLGLSFKKASEEKDYRLRLDKEIETALVAKKNGRSIASVDSIHYPECFAYAKETSNDKLKSLLIKKKVESVEPISPSGAHAVSQ